MSQILFRAVKAAMVDSVLLCLAIIIPCIFTVLIWSLSPFVGGDEIELPIKAW